MLTRRRFGGSTGGCCSGANFSQTFTIVGCVNPANKPSFFQSQTVQVYDTSGGTLLASGTTNSSGSVVLSWNDTGTPTRYITATTPWTGRNDAHAANHVLSNGGSTTLALAAHTGFNCCPGVDWAVPNTVHWSDSDTTVALTFASNGWHTSYNENATVAGCDNDPTCTCVLTNGHPYLTIGASCGGNNQFAIGRAFKESFCCSSNRYSVTAAGCPLCTLGAQYSTNYDGSGGPPINFSGTLSTQTGGGTLTDPVGGTTTLTE